MNDSKNVIKRDPKVQIKIKELLDKYNRLPHSYQSKLVYDTLIRNVVLKELICIMSTPIVDIDIELKMKITVINHLVSRFLCLYYFI